LHIVLVVYCFFFSSRRRHTRSKRDWSSDVCSSDLPGDVGGASIGALAKSAGVSASTISRLAAHLGYSGYPAMRADIATDVGREVQAGWLSDIGDQISMESGALDRLRVLSAHQHRAARRGVEARSLPAEDPGRETMPAR